MAYSTLIYYAYDKNGNQLKQEKITLLTILFGGSYRISKAWFVLPEIGENIKKIKFSIAPNVFKNAPQQGVIQEPIGTITEIGENIFSANLFSKDIEYILELPSSITTIGDGSLNKFSTIIFKGTINNWGSIRFTSKDINQEGCNYIHKGTKLYCSEGEVSGDLDFTEKGPINPLAFANCSYITGIKFKYNTIIENVFNNCDNLKNITIIDCDGEWNLGWSQFTSLEEVTFEGTNIILPEGVLSPYKKLTNISFTNLTELSSSYKIENHILYQDSNLFHCFSDYENESFKLPADCVRICKGSFLASGNNLKNIIVAKDNSLLTVGENVCGDNIDILLILKEGFSQEDLSIDTNSKIRCLGINCSYLNLLDNKESRLIVDSGILDVYYYDSGNERSIDPDDYNQDILMLPESIKKISSSFFSDYAASFNVYLPASLEDIFIDSIINTKDIKFYYKGSEEKWNSLNKKGDLINILYFSAEKPKEEDLEKYWTIYADGFKLSSKDKTKIFDSYGFKIFKDGSIEANAGKLGAFSIYNGSLSAEGVNEAINLTPKMIEAKTVDGKNYCRIKSDGTFEANNATITGRIETKELQGESFLITKEGASWNEDVDNVKFGFQDAYINFKNNNITQNFKIYLLMQNWGTPNSAGKRWNYSYAIYCEDIENPTNGLPRNISIPITFIATNIGDGSLLATVNYEFIIEKGTNQSAWYNNSNLHEGSNEDRSLSVQVAGNQNIIYIGALSDPNLVKDRSSTSQDDNLKWPSEYITRTDLHALTSFLLTSEENKKDLFINNINLMPEESGTQDIGSNFRFWRNGFFSGTVVLKDLNSSIATVSEDLEVGGTTYDNSGSAVTSSDIKVKNNIEPLSDKYSILFDELKPVSYKYNVGTSGRSHTGFIAQDVKSAMDAAALTTEDFAGYCEWINSDGSSETGLRYAEFIALCVKEIQDLKKKVTSLEEKLINATFDKVD